MTTVTQVIARARGLLRHDSNSPGSIEELIALLNGIRPDDVSARMPDVHGSRWQMKDLATTSHFAFTLFMIPRGQIIPFHDHPFMRVLMRALWGHLHVDAYDWVQKCPGGGLARHTYDVSMDAEDDTLIIEPDHGNLHRVVADEDCAFVDLAVPPYSDDQGRHCQFYRVAGQQLIDEERLTRLILGGHPKPAIDRHLKTGHRT
jgi:cysteamine dioxygenase